jgi:hypothetical protein
MSSRLLFFCFLLSVLHLSGCIHSEVSKATLFSLLPASQTGIDFNNTITENDSMNLILNEYLYNGGGVAVGDINNDGLPDLFFSDNMVSSKLYLNKGNFKFEDVTNSAGVTTTGWCTGVNMVDINADGYIDIYVCVAGPGPSGQRANILFINNKNSTFTEEGKEYNLADTSHSTQAAFFDYDRDGDLDMYLMNHVISKGSINPNLLRAKLINGENSNTDKLYRNEGNVNGHPVFKDVSKEAGITIEGYGLGLAISDLNQDGWPDIYVCNDYLSNDLLWINNKDGTFTNKISSAIKHQSNSAMGNDIADINNDGLQDVLTLDMMPEDNYHRKMMHDPTNYDRREAAAKLGYQPQSMRNMLQVNQGFKENGDPYFSEAGQYANIYATDWSWSVLMADFDNDGFRDIHITNGFPRDLTNGDFITYRQRLYNTKVVSDQQYVHQLIEELEKIPGRKIKNYFYKNTGQLNFVDKTDDWGISKTSYSNGAVYADLDNDGDLDIVTNNINDAPFVLRNNLIKDDKLPVADTINFLQIKFKGNDQNLNGLGSIIRYALHGNIQMVEQNPCRGFMSTIENRLHIGLGKDSIIDSLYICWPTGKSQLLKNIASNQTLVLDENLAKPDNGNLEIWKRPSKTNKEDLQFQNCTRELGIGFKHQEESYIDYNSSALLPQKYSQLGPGISVGDLNGDGLDDFFVGNGYKHSGELFFQQQNGKFASRPLITGTKYQEDMGNLLFDADGDKDLDLYVVSGTSEFVDGSPYQQDRLYINDGHGNFKIDTSALPVLTSSGSCAVAGDIDNDGSLALFVGGRQIPGKYPLSPRSYLLKNINGKFVDATSSLAPELENIGMVTSALWTDFDNDGQTDLIVAGEWMPICFFKNYNGKLKKLTTNISSTSTGWWNSIIGGDFDNDGDTDYMLGNLGLNAKLKATVEHPINIEAADYNKNGSVDAVMGYWLKGKDGKLNNFPVPQREILITTIPSARKFYNLFDDYANAGMNSFIAKLNVKPLFSAKAHELRSVYLENLGGGKFSMHALPLEVQLAPQFGMTVGDFNGDENLDVLMGGNSYSSDVSTGQYDATYGLCLMGDGQGHFSVVKHTGFFADGDSKGMAQLCDKNNNPIFLVARNNDSLLAFKQVKNIVPKLGIIPSANPYGSSKIKLSNGQYRKVEYYYCSGYLSQSSKKFIR